MNWQKNGTKRIYKQQLHTVYMFSNNVRHLITKTIITLQYFATLNGNNSSSDFHQVLTGAQNIAKEIKRYQKKKWLQHVQRMDTNRLPKQALQYKPKGWRYIGRPRKRWRDQLHLVDQGTGKRGVPILLGVRFQFPDSYTQNFDLTWRVAIFCKGYQFVTWSSKLWVLLRS